MEKSEVSVEYGKLTEKLLNKYGDKRKILRDSCSRYMQDYK